MCYSSCNAEITVNIRTWSKMRHGIIENITHLNRCDCFADHACNAPCRARSNHGVHYVTGSVKSARPVSTPLDLAEVSGGSRRSADHVDHGIRVHQRHTEDADASHQAAGSGHECVAHATHSSLHRGVRRCWRRARSAARRTSSRKTRRSSMSSRYATACLARRVAFEPSSSHRRGTSTNAQLPRAGGVSVLRLHTLQAPNRAMSNDRVQRDAAFQ